MIIRPQAHNRKLPSDQALRAMFAAGEKNVAIAKRFGVSQSNVTRAKQRIFDLAESRRR